MNAVRILVFAMAGNTIGKAMTGLQGAYEGAYAQGWMAVERQHGGTSRLWIAKAGESATRPRR